MADSTTKAPIAKGDNPSAAIARANLAVAEGNEDAFRRAIVVRSLHGYSESYFRWGLASARLHRAVRAPGITGQRVKLAGWDRNESLSPNILDPASVPADQQPYRPTEWIIDGNSARRRDGESLNGTQGDTTIKRIDHRWIVIVSDPADGSAEQLRVYAKGWQAMAGAIDATTAQVQQGKFKSIREVNDFFDRELAKRENGKGNGKGEGE